MKKNEARKLYKKNEARKLYKKNEARKLYKKKHPEGQRRSRQRNYAKGRVHQAAPWADWTLEEVELIIAANRPSDRTLARHLRRSVQSIQMKRHRIMKARNHNETAGSKRVCVLQV